MGLVHKVHDMKLASETLRLELTMDRPAAELSATGARMLITMRQLHHLGLKSRIDQQTKVALTLGLNLMEMIAQGLALR